MLRRGGNGDSIRQCSCRNHVYGRRVRGRLFGDGCRERHGAHQHRSSHHYPRALSPHAAEMAEPKRRELREFRDERGLSFARVAAAAFRAALTGLLGTAFRRFTVTFTLFVAHGSS